MIQPTGGLAFEGAVVGSGAELSEGVDEEARGSNSLDGLRSALGRRIVAGRVDVVAELSGVDVYECDFVLLDCLQEHLQVESGHHDELDASLQCLMDEPSKTVYVEEGEDT